MTQLLENIFAVEVPNDAKDFVIDMGYLIFKVMDMNPKKWVTDKQIEQDVRRFLRTGKSRFDDLKEESMWQTTGMPIPPGSYEILFTTKDCTEEQADAIVPDTVFPSPIDGLKFQLRTHNLDPSKNYLLLKKLS